MRLKLYISESEAGKMVIKRVEDCSRREIKDFYSLVDAGNEAYISLGDVRSHGILLGFYYINNELASVSALKDDDRKDGIFNASGTDEDPDNYDYEIGWSYTLPKYRRLGLNNKLYTALEDQVDGKIYQTIRTTNAGSLGSAKKNGYRIVGDEIDVGVFNIYLLVK